MSHHILIVTTDSLRSDHLGCYGHPDNLTPNLDAFAASGVRFEHHLSTLSTTLPSHTSLLTGCPPSVHGVTWNGVKTPRRRLTLAELAREHGYATSAVTSWGGFQDQQVYGFEDVYSESGAGAEENRGDYTITRVEACIKRMDPSRPQAMWVHLIDPHTPDNCPDPFPKTYAGEVNFVDGILGRLVAAWDARLGADSSIVTLTADHGEHLNDHGIERGHGTLWHQCLRIPLLMRSPGPDRTRTVVDDLTRQIDVLPTLLDFADLPLPHNVIGTSLRGHIAGTDSGTRLVHQGQAMREHDATFTLRNEHYAFHFNADGDLVHIFDRRVDLDEETDLWNGGSAGHSVAHSIKDAQEGA